MPGNVALGVGNTSVISFSCSLDLLNQIEEVRKIKLWKRSPAIRILLQYGLIYLKMLDSGYFEEKPTETN